MYTVWYVCVCVCVVFMWCMCPCVGGVCVCVCLHAVYVWGVHAVFVWVCTPCVCVGRCARRACV